MYPAEKIRKIKHLLSQNISHRVIAHLEFVSPELVRDVAVGKRTEKDKQAPKSSMHPSPFAKSTDKRCPACGTKGSVPCKLCATRADDAKKGPSLEIDDEAERKARRKLEAGQTNLANAGHDPSLCCGVCGLGPIRKTGATTYKCELCHSDTCPAPSLAEIRRVCTSLRAEAIANAVGKDVRLR